MTKGRNTQILHVRLPDHQAKRIIAEAHAQGRTVSEHIRLVLEQHAANISYPIIVKWTFSSAADPEIPGGEEKSK